MLAKKELRTQMMAVRNALNIDNKNVYDSKICNRIIEIIQIQKPSTVHCYLPMGSEIDIKPIISFLLHNNIKVIAPKTLRHRKLQNLVLHSLDDIEMGLFNTWHPAGNEEYSGVIDLVIMPGLAFDRQLYRLGYGAGYYDNFLHGYPEAHKLGICYPFQVVNQVPTESHDVQLDELLYFESINV